MLQGSPRAWGLRPPPPLLLLLLLLLWLVPGPGASQGDHQGEPVTPHWVLDGHGASLEGSKRLMALEAEGQELLLELEKKQLLAPGYTETHYNPDGQPVVLVQKDTDHCHYHGQVRGYSDSWVVLSTCSGMSGLITLSSNTSYYLRAWPPTLSKDPWTHKIFRMEQLFHWKGACGHNTSSDRRDSTGLPGAPQSRGHHCQERRATHRSMRYLELYLVADHTLFLTQHRNLNRTKQRLLEVVHYVDQFLRTLDIQVELAGLEVWTEQDLSPVTSDANATLWAFLQWRRGQWALQPHDSTQLLTGRAFQDATAGLAPVEGMCLSESSGGVSTDHSELALGAAATMAHEIGHSLGLSHDPEDCCTEALRDQGGCVMGATMGRPFPRVFSACSRRQLRAFFRKGGGACLSDAPAEQPARCGNGLVEAGEECDCGAFQECPDPCCLAHNCSLRAGAQCARGDCCARCLLKPAGELCRQAAGDCDLPEFCTGASPHCPPDVYVLDGWPCAMGHGYCRDGACPTLEQQCQQFWGPGARPAQEACFQVVNSAGDAHGHCGQDSQGRFVPCAQRDAKCGKLQCQGGEQGPRVPDTLSVDSTISVDGQNVTCRGASALLPGRLDLLDLGLVDMGTLCGPQMVCQDRRCQNATFQELAHCLAACHAHGVCNSNYNCHCAPGWAPPSCDQPGLGGSIDSGPVPREKHEAFLLATVLSFLLPLLPGAGLAWCCYRCPRSRSCLQQQPWGSRRCPACCGPKVGPSRDQPLGSSLSMELDPVATEVPGAPGPDNSAGTQQLT